MQAQIQRLHTRVQTLEDNYKSFRLLFTKETAPLMRTSLQNRNYEEVEFLLGNGFDPSFPLTSVGTKQDRWNVFLYLVQAGRHQTVDTLLSERLVNVNYSDSDGFSALEIAAGRGDVEMVKVLIRHGAKVDPQGYSAALARGEEGVGIANLLLMEVGRRGNDNR